ncbi:MAG: hypothetical protein ABI537_02070 [Casimicrobiaceae bacterium]
MVYEISVKYDNGTWGTVRQTASPPFRIGDRVLATDRGLEFAPKPACRTRSGRRNGAQW